MQHDNITLIKLGGSLITYKEDEQRIEEYLSIIDKFRDGKTSINELTAMITALHDQSKIKEIFQIIRKHMQSDPSSKFVIVHGAGSIGHSLVLHLLQDNPDLRRTFPIVKLAVSIQNQLLVAVAAQAGINAISCSNHQIMLGYPTNKTSTSRIDAMDLSAIETIIQESDAVPIFYGDVGFTQKTDQQYQGEWKVFSGDLVPNALVRRLSHLHISKVIFLTYVEGRKTGIYSTDPIDPEAELIKRIEVDNNQIKYFNVRNEQISFQTGSNESKYDVTDAMEGKLRNIIDLANRFTTSSIIGVEDLEQALRGEEVGTTVIPKNKQQVNVTILGSGDAFSSGGFKSAGSLIDLPDKRILLDCGPHTLQALKAINRKTTEIDWIIITHFHGDHFGGVPYLLLESIFQHQRVKPLTIIGPPGIEDRVKRLFSELYAKEGGRMIPFPCIYQEITPGDPFEQDDILIQAHAMNHTPEAQGYRIKVKSRVIAYTGDTGWTENLFSLIKEADLAIMECNFYESQFETHLNWQEINKLYSYAKKTAIIHFGEEMIRKLSSLITTEKIIIPLEGEVIRL